MTAGRRLSRAHREWLAAYLFLAPDVIGLLVFVVVPMVLSLSLGFYAVDGFGGYTFIGLDNYRHMFNDPLFTASLRVTATYVLVLVPGLYVVGLGLALLLKRKFPFIGLIRSMFFLPFVVSLVVVGVVWQFMLTDEVGVINRLFEALGLGSHSWLGDPQFALATILFVAIWVSMGYYMLLFLAGLQEIPPEYYEAAQIDGASNWAAFRHITFPLLKPTSFFIILTSLVSSMTGSQSFDLPYIMTKGGPANTTSSLIFYIYQQAFMWGDYGYAAAMASFLVLVLVVATALAFLVTKGGRFEFD